MILEIHNHGPLILATNYWESEYAAAGKFYCSINAGAIRLLVPQSQRLAIENMRAAPQVVLSRGPWPERGLVEAVELLFDDGTDNPYALYLSPESFDLLPAEPESGREWVLSAWTKKKNVPHKAVERLCRWRRVPRLPWLEPWQ
jgi:hypothetical protein